MRLCFIMWYSLKQQNNPRHPNGHRWDFYFRTLRYLVTWQGAMMIAQSMATPLWDWLNTDSLIRLRKSVLSYNAGSRNLNWCTQLKLLLIISIISFQLTSLINSSPPNAAYMRWWTGPTLVQIIAWSAPSHYLNQCWNVVNWTLGNNL